VKYIYSILILFLFAQQVDAGWRSTRENLDKVYQLDKLRIFYSLKGKHALPKENKKDKNNNKTPDYIENLASRLHVALLLFTDSFGLSHPLQRQRYKNKAKYIDIHILNKDSKGSTGDAIVKLNYKALKGSKDKSITMRLSTKLRKGTLTPVHEMFHVVQNGYTMFKNRWYTEGTSRWAEYAQKKGTGSRKKLPKNTKELKKILGQTYKTKRFWRRLAYLLDKNNGRFQYSKNQTEVVVGYPTIVEDNRIYGYNFIKTFLEELDKMDAVAARNYGLPEHDWKEEQQRSKANNVYILCALKNAIQLEYDKKIRNKEIENFVKVVDKYTNSRCYTM